MGPPITQGDFSPAGLPSAEPARLPFLEPEQSLPSELHLGMPLLPEFVHGVGPFAEPPVPLRQHDAAERQPLKVKLDRLRTPLRSGASPFVARQHGVEDGGSQDYQAGASFEGSEATQAQTTVMM